MIWLTTRLCKLAHRRLVFQMQLVDFYGEAQFQIFKGQLRRFYKFMSYERAFKMLKNDMCITEIGQAILEL